MWVNQDQFRLLKKNTLFKGVPESHLKSFLNPKNFIKVEDGSIIYSLDGEASDIYLVIEGEVKIKFYKAKSIEIKILFDFFGEAEILERSKRFSSAVANKDCVFYKMSLAELNDLCEGSKNVITNLKKKDEPGINEQFGGKFDDLDAILDPDDLAKDNDIIDFDQEKQEESLKKLSDEDLNTILEKQRNKHDLDGDLNDNQNIKDDDFDDL